MQSIGLTRVTLANIVAKLSADGPANYIPSATAVQTILREKFGLKYRAANAANTKYNDTTYDEKRLWVSRLLAQFLMADVIVISIDESSFKQEGIRHRYW